MNEIRVYPPKPNRIYFFATCLVDLFYPSVGLAGIDLLNKEEIEVEFPQEQTCCGQPAYTSGYSDESRKVAQKQLHLFKENYLIVVPSGSCAGMMRVHYPKLFKGTADEALAENVASRVFELTEFLLYVCKIKLIDHGEPISLAIHTSCSARRELGLGNTAIQLLTQLKNVEIKEQERATECCGFGGTFAVRHPNISAAMVEDKIKAIKEAKVKSFVTGDCGCLMNIKGAMDKQKNTMESPNEFIDGSHIIDFIWRRTHGK